MLHHVFIISDGTGRTAKQALKAALVQFQNNTVKTYLRAYIRNEEQIIEVIKEAYKLKGLIIHTLVSKHLRHLILEKGRLFDVPTIDIMGPLLAQLSLHFENTPAEIPGIYHTLNKAYFQRIEAIEYTLRHDDGQRLYNLHKSDLVLLGVSRTFKTPLSVYMAHKGWQVANIPIILNLPPPTEIYKVNPERVFCLTTFPKKLAALRKIRSKHLKNLTGNYATLEHVQKELNYALKLFIKHPRWNIINVTNKPIEEISSEILNILRTKISNTTNATTN